MQIECSKCFKKRFMEEIAFGKNDKFYCKHCYPEVIDPTKTKKEEEAEF